MLTVLNKSESARTGDHSKYVLAPHVSFVVAPDGTARLLDMGGGFYALPVIGAQMLERFLERGREAVIEELAQKYAASPAKIGADLDVLIMQLCQKKLVRQGSRHRPDVGLWLARCLTPFLSVLRFAPAFLRPLLVLTITKLSLLIFGWARTVTVWQSCLQRFEKNADLRIDEDKVRALDQAVRRAASGHPLPMACKERALTCWALLRWTGAPAALVVGLEFFPLVGHCWCELGSMIVSDFTDHCEFYTPVLRYT